MNYTIKAVNPQTRAYSTKFGEMVSYKVLFEGIDTPVEISQKASSKAPAVGDSVDGTIDMSAPYGPKFKKEFNQGSFGSGGSSFGQSSQGNRTNQSSGSTGGKFNSDPFTMYLSYAKDVAVALIASKNGYDASKFAEVLDDVITGGKTLYGSRPGAEPEAAQAVDEKPLKDVLPTEEEVDNFLPEDIAAIFEKSDPADVWPDDAKS